MENIISSLLFIFLIILFPVYPILIIFVFFFGILFSMLLKNIFKQQRPSFNNYINDYGMPSTHIQSYSILLSYFIINKNYSLATITLFLIIITYISKLHNKDHTNEQMVIGFLIGQFIMLFSYFIYLIISL